MHEATVRWEAFEELKKGTNRVISRFSLIGLQPILQTKSSESLLMGTLAERVARVKQHTNSFRLSYLHHLFFHPTLSIKQMDLISMNFHRKTLFMVVNHCDPLPPKKQIRHPQIPPAQLGSLPRPSLAARSLRERLRCLGSPGPAG